MTWLRFVGYKYNLPDWLRGVARTLDTWYYEIRNRFFAKYYRIDIRGMPKGAWWDTDHRMFEVVWQLFEDFVENEVAHMAAISGGDDESELTHSVADAYKKASRKDRKKNNAEWRRKLAMEYWEWETALTNAKIDEWYDGNEPDKLTPQAEKAIEIRELYLWWKDIRPNRPDVWKGLHYDPEFELLENGYSKLVSSNRNWTQKQLDEATALENAYEEEDTKKTQQLIAIRHCLWT